MENNIPVTEAELAEWQALCDAANPEPWEGSFLAGTNATWADHRFANGSRTIMPRLIAEVRRLRGVVDAERSDHEDTRKYWQKICMRAARDADREINQLASAMSADTDRIKKAETENARLSRLLSRILDIANDSPELNMANYDEEQVSELNGCMVQIYALLVRNVANASAIESTQNDGAA